MAVNDNDIDKIHAILCQLQPQSIRSLQIINNENKFRSNCLLTDKINYNGSCKFVYFNIPNFNNWHKKNI